MKKELAKIKNNFLKEIDRVENIAALKKIDKNFLGRQGALKQILASLKGLSQEERKIIGKAANELRSLIRESLRAKKQELVLKERNQSGQDIDASLPGRKILRGHLHPLTQTLLDVERVFESMGFSVFLSPEVENEYYNFDALNVPANHPARDLWDTFWLDDLAPEDKKGKLLLRTHTSAMQGRYMEQHNPPFRIITPGRCFRYEASDNSHDIQFYQIDGLVVDKQVSIANFRAIMEELFKKLISDNVKIRLRPGYFPFVEPGFEMDIACYKCQGKDCPVCKGSHWLEIMGAGMVHPEVFKKAGYNPAHWQGFAFGMGLDRIAMIRYGVSDVRMFYQNDTRFLKQF